MLFCSYDEQRSFPEYIDMVFQEIYYEKACEDNLESYPIGSWQELYDLIISGYLPDFGKMPVYVENEYYHKSHKRRLKKYVKKLFSDYGEPREVDIRLSLFNTMMEQMENWQGPELPVDRFGNTMQPCF